MKRIVCLGDPVMDIVVHVPNSFLSEQNLDKGGCMSVDAATLQSLAAAARRASSDSIEVTTPGGSAANVAKVLAQVSSQYQVSFIGMVGLDASADEYRSKMTATGVSPLLLSPPASPAGRPSSMKRTASNLPHTAHCLCLVTPDGQRTMRTHLGACTLFQQASLLPMDAFSNLALLHCEGYCMYRANVALEAMRRAKRGGALVSLDLASFETVENCIETLKKMLQEGLVDVLFANEEEAHRLAELLLPTPLAPTHTPVTSLPAAASLFAPLQRHLVPSCRLSIISLGARGCIAMARDGSTGQSMADGVKVEDTIGAGDAFTAGFLFAFLRGGALEQACAAGCAAGGAAVQERGATLSKRGVERLRGRMQRLLQGSSGGVRRGDGGKGKRRVVLGGLCAIVLAVSVASVRRKK